MLNATHRGRQRPAAGWFSLLCRLGVCLGMVGRLIAGSLSDPAVDSYNVRVSTQTFSGLYKFTTNTLLVETAEAITNLGADTIKCYLGPNTAGQSGVTMPSGVTNLMLLVRNEPSYHKVLDMPFRHFIMWAYPLATGGTGFQDGNYTPTESAKDYREMYDLTQYLLTNYNNSAKTFYLGHWEGDGYLSVNNWTTNPSPAVVTAMIAWENNRQKAVDDAKAATSSTNVSVYYYAEANRVRDAMFNGTNNNVRMIDSVIPFVSNLDYVSYSSYDAQNLSAADLYTTLNYMEAHFPTNKAGKVPGERMWIGEYGWGNLSTAAQEPLTRSYIQRLLGWQGKAGPLQYILFWEMYNNQSTGGTNFCLIDPTDTKMPCYFLLQRYLNQAKLLTAQFKEKNGRLPTDAEFSSMAPPMLNGVLPAPIALSVQNLPAVCQTVNSATLSGTLAQGIYGDDEAGVWVFWGPQDGGTVSTAWGNSRFLGLNTNFNPATFSLLLTNLTTQTNYFYRFYSSNAGGSAWAPASAQLSTVSLNPPDYTNRMRINLGGYTRSETLVNFPALVSLGPNLPGFSYAQFASGTGGDLRFTDASGLVPIPFEIDEWNPGGTSSVWVQVPALAATNSYIWAYWGNSAAARLPSSSTNGAVWLPGHDLVWHLAHSTFPVLDSTTQFPGVSGVAPTSVTAEVGHGGSFNGTSDYIGSGSVNLGNAFTVSAWVKLAANATNIQTIWANKASGWNSDGFALFANSFNTTDGKLILETGDGTTGTTAESATGTILPGQWHRITAAINRAGGGAQLFVDGNNVTATSSVTADLNNVGSVNLGRFTNGTYYLNGIIDEARIENGLSSSNWIWAGWANVTSNASFVNFSVVNPRPNLSVTSDANGSMLTWPASAGVLNLYTATNLTPPISWSPATNLPAIVNGQWQVPLSPNANPVCYYRLQYR